MIARRCGAGALVLLALFVLAGCATPSEPRRIATAPPPASPSFQTELDWLGVPLDLPAEGKAILVNIPAFELIAFEDAEPAFRSRAIVGTTANPTPILATYTTTVRFRPTWRPTPAMIASGEYEDRVWPPGENNPLGLAAIRLEPGLLVYLHDTNRRGLFGDEYRALSHGCIRVERWRELVAWLLDMEPARVDRLAHGDETVDVPTPRIPVYLAYLTIFPDEDGDPERHPDVYDRPDVAPTHAAPSARVDAACAPVEG